MRNIALTNGLVDIKVCAVDEIWSALKLVIPVKDRTYDFQFPIKDRLQQVLGIDSSKNRNRSKR